MPNGFELRNDLINGLILRPTKRFDFQKAKEFNVSVPSILTPIPFGLDRESLLSKQRFLLTEGHIDALSLEKEGLAYVAIPGVQNVQDEWLCLLKGKKVYIAFDMDTAGRESAKKLKERLLKYTQDIKILEWDKKYKDLNELLLSGKINSIVI